MEQVTLKIVGTQNSFGEEENTIEMMTQGKCYEKNNCFYIVYEESEVSGMEGSTTTIKIDDKQIMMKRFGSNQSKMVFEKGQRHKTTYQTVYGAMAMEVLTDKIKIKRDKEGIRKLELLYRLNVSQTTEMKNRLIIELI